MIQTVVLAAGISSRMRPLTNNCPKPMLKFGGKPILQYVIENLRQAGIVDIIITTHYLPEVITNYFGDGSRFGVNITYSFEPRLLDTAGSLKKLKSLLKEEFLVCGGHFIMLELDFADVVRFHRDKGGIGTVVFKKLEDHNYLRFFGQGIFNADRRLKLFAEKPEIVLSSMVHTTYQIFDKRVLLYIPDNKPASIPEFLIPTLLYEGLPLYCYVAESELINISSMELYQRAQAMLVAT